MSQHVRTCLIGLLLLALDAASLAQDVHILLRAKDGKTEFQLGENLSLEAACVAMATGHYLLPCEVVLEAEGVSSGSRVSADRIDQTTWLDAQTGELPPGLRGRCGNLNSRLPSEVSDAPAWREIDLKEPFPVYVGQYKISAKLAYDLEVSDRYVEPVSHSTSDEVEVDLDDNLRWKDRLIHFHRCDYDDPLTLVPDSDAIAALRKHLRDCAVDDDQSFAQLLHHIVWLKMQVEQPELYTRMVELEHTRLPFRGENEAELQKSELEQTRLGAKGDAKQIQTFFHDQYRELLLETARLLVPLYRSHPEARNEDFDQDEEDGFGNWHDAAATLAGGADSYVTPDEVTKFLKQAGRSNSFIATFLKEHKSSLPGELPEYQHR